jgi:L-threonylcarbamoyladenylate synthase
MKTGVIMQTVIYKPNIEGIEAAAGILKNGGLVGIPTETVYGLAANALDGPAVSKIFKVKGRPQDNPLIVHISELGQLSPLVLEVPENAIKLANAFWPGPLTIILRKSEIIPMKSVRVLKLLPSECPRTLSQGRLFHIRAFHLPHPRQTFREVQALQQHFMSITTSTEKSLLSLTEANVL